MFSGPSRLSNWRYVLNKWLMMVLTILSQSVLNLIISVSRYVSLDASISSLGPFASDSPATEASCVSAGTTDDGCCAVAYRRADNPIGKVVLVYFTVLSRLALLGNGGCCFCCCCSNRIIFYFIANPMSMSNIIQPLVLHGVCFLQS